MQVGHLVAVNCENYADGPSIGKCIEVTDTTVHLEWMKGKYSSSWPTWIVMKNAELHQMFPLGNN